ncbi:unnamed protein product [Paramecium pentaurelia]|uniref:Uncharacterized protein n=1 Tax=Paramecium pentaurelia TaxID=43138 RepID=A0A8S1U2V3_9CILI|nr:unnamed protein product [Paramecium pentaurelia]
MQKLVDFSELQTLQIDQIYSLFISLIENSKCKPDSMSQGFICPHTVSCNLEIMQFDDKKCNICSNQIFLSKKTQLSGILFFLLGGLKEGQGKVEEFYQNIQDYFSPIIGILSEQQIFRSLCILINETEFEKKLSMYEKITSLNEQIQPKIYKYKLKKFCIVTVDPNLGFLYQQNELEEITLVTSFKIFMEQYQQLLINLKLSFKDFKICIHNLFLGSKNKKYHYLKFNLFYDYLCKQCHQNKFSLLFYEILINQSFQRNSQNNIQSLTNDVHQLSKNQNEENDFIELFHLLQKYLNNQGQMAYSGFFTQNISFFSRDIMQQLKTFQTQDLLWQGYKILVQQEIVELIENSINKNDTICNSAKKKLFDSYQVQVQLIQAFNNYQSIPIFDKIVKKYSDLIQDNNFQQIDDINNLNQSPLLQKRQQDYQFMKQFNTFTDYKNACNQKQIQPIFQEIDYRIIKQYEEQLKDGIIQ